MARTRRNWAADVIDDLFDFAVTNTSFRPEGIFLDIGANIGTTSIYVKKNWPELDIVAFEPGKKNYDLFRANCILNGIEDYCIENIGLGEKASEGFLFYRSYNPGGSMIVSEKNEISQEQVKIKSIDEYISDNKIKPQDISFIWMDTEGFEADIIIGSRNLLGQKSVPLVNDFDPNIYERRGKLREYLKIMSNTYTYFFDVNRKENGRYIVESIDGFDKWIDTHKNKTDLFFF
jgi:FkbM family methyltransferase